ncbi:tetratricopeptide repeat protein [Planktothrix agardhii]|uniref:tetratricopeptide repeat protein n=1 Tax=Planktothrix agardhii TaxID=1160 RepID=UPI001D09B062|nr:tetratricopeptide repeat protein [Planktothrix agardhii]MCB8751254.1 tetratricopeptide repeat protein [Planktothrix agardhii 1810]
MNFLTKVNLNKNIEGSEQFCKFDFDPVPEVIEKHLKLSGWVVGIESPVVGIELIQDGQLLWESPLTINRSLVYQTDKTVTGEQQCGFSINLALENINLASPVILIQAVFEDFKRIPLADLNLSKAEESNQDLAQAKAELHNTREELERLQSQFDEVLAELEQTHWQLHQVQTKQSDSDVTIDSDKQVIEVNPEDIQSYYRFLEVQPENSDIWLQLANILVEQNRLEDAIAAYRRLVELSPCAEYYQQLGELLVKQEKWDEAIIVYKRAIQFNPESYLYYYQLGGVIYNRVMQNPESFFVDYKIAELPHKDYQLFDTELPEVCFLNDQAFLQATAHLDDATYTVEWYRVYLRRSLSEAEKQGCINWLQTPGNSRELGLQVWRSSVSEFQKILRKSIFVVSLEEVVSCYRQAIALNPENHEFYDVLADTLCKQEKRDEAIKLYHQAGLKIAELGQINQGVTCFEKATKIYFDQEKTYDIIWERLNQPIVSNINDFDYPSELQKETIENYFTRTSQYKIMNLWDLTETDKDFLNQKGFLKANLDIIAQDSIPMEEIYINNFDPDHEFRLSNISPKKDNYQYKLVKHFNQPNVYQQSIVETGYIYSVCPVTGQILRSNQSFYDIGWQFAVSYRFVGREIYYLVVGHFWGPKTFIYFPRLELIIHLNNHLRGSEVAIINRLKSSMVSHYQQVIGYLSTEVPKKVASISGLFSNIGHYFWNEVTGLQFLSDNNLLEKIDQALIEPQEYFNIGDIFPEIADKIIRVKDKQSMFKTIVENNCCAVRLTNVFVKENLANRTYQSSYKKCSPLFIEGVEQAKNKHFPLLWVGFRSHNKMWISQVEGIANIIKSLSEDFPNLGVVLDGWSRTEREDDYGESMIATDKITEQQILELLPNNIPTYSAVGIMTYEKVIWACAIDLYLMPLSSGGTFVSWIANKPGFMHANHSINNEHLREQVSQSRENPAPISFISVDSVFDQEAPPHIIAVACQNYDFDWKIVYNEAVKIINSLNQNTA